MPKRNLFDVDWLEAHKAKRKEQGGKRPVKQPPLANLSARKLAQKLEREKLSPHFIALQYLAKHPDDFKGNQEHYEQTRVFWHFECEDPEIYLRLHATPNGGLRHDRTAGRMKAEGQKRGYPDMTYDKPRGNYCGLRLELKYNKNNVSEEQKEWLNRLSDDGYYCVLCYGAQQAIDAITAYDKLGDFEEMPEHINDHRWKKIPA